jgi:RNA polymerase sigma factor (sigma-70 family)
VTVDNSTTTRILRRLHASFCVRRSAAESDRQLLGRFVDGDQDAFTALVSRHGRTVLAACRQVLTDPADVDDAFQATFLVLFKKAPLLTREESIGRWLYSVAHRVAVHSRSNAARRRDREAAAGSQRPTDASPPDLSWREACAVLHEELDRLPEHYRLPLLLCYLEGQSRDEAAKNLGWSAGTVKGRLERGRQALAGRLARRGITLSAGLLAATAASPAQGAGLPSGLVERTRQAVAGGASRSVAALARGAFPGSLASRKAIASVLLLTALLGVGVERYATAVVAREEPPRADKTTVPAADPPDGRPVSGRVLDPDGKPVAGAKVYVPALRSPLPAAPGDVEIRTTATSGADGRFTIAASPLGSSLPSAFVIAYVPGYGVAWAEIQDVRADQPIGELTLRLTRDVPVTGRVINTEGRPMRGASVSLAAVHTPPDDNLDDYLANWKRDVRNVLFSPKQRLDFPISRITGPTTTDRDGRFTLRGAGAERIARVLVDGGGEARALVSVVTRPGFDPKPYNDLLLRKENDVLRVGNRFRGLFAPDFTVITEPGRQLTGVVTDADTGEPVAGCRLSAFVRLGDVLRCETDARGRYRLDGVPKDSKGYRVSVYPPPGTDYLLPEDPSTSDVEGLAPVRLDAKLKKGQVVVGRLVDKQTGKGVKGGVRFAPLPENKFFGTRPEYNRYATDRSPESTDAEGRFRVVTIPGPALLMAKSYASEKLGGEDIDPYRGAKPDPDRKDLFQRDGSGWYFNGVQNAVEILEGFNAVKVVDVKETGETAVGELSFDRGVTVRLEVRAPDGKPLAGARVAGIAECWRRTVRLTEPAGTVYSLDPAKPRTLIFFHPERHLGGTVTVDPGESGPVVAKLGPLGRVTGRLLDTDGQPLAGATVAAVPTGQLAYELYHVAGPGGPPVRVDKDGRFTLTDVLSDVSLRLEYRKGDVVYGDKARQAALSLKPGESRDVGDRTLEPRQ